MVKNLIEHLRLSSITFGTVKGQRFAHFKIHETFIHLGIDFSISLNQYFRTGFDTFKIKLLLLEILTDFITGLKHAVAVLLHQAYCLTCIYNCIIFFLLM